MRKPSVFVSSASLILTDYLPAGEGLISYNLLKHIANTNKYNFNVFAPEIKIRNDLKGINIFNPGKYSFFPAPEEYSYLRQWNSYSGKIRKIYEKGLFESDIIHHMLPFNFNQSYSPVLDNPLIIGPVFHPWTGISDEEYSVTEIKTKNDFVLLRKFKTYMKLKYKEKNKILFQQTLEKADKIVVTLDCVKNFFNEKYHSKIVKIPIGTDTKYFKPVNELADNNTVLFLAYLVKRKGLEYLIKAVDIIRKRIPEIKLMIVGDGPDKEYFMSLIKNLNLENYIEIHNGVEHKDTVEFFRKAQIYVLPSLCEPFGMSAVEAMSCGLPVVGTSAGGLPEVLGKHNNENLAEPRNPDALSEIIIRLLMNFDKCVELGKINRDYAVRNYDWRVIAGKYTDLYDSVL